MTAIIDNAQDHAANAETKRLRRLEHVARALCRSAGVDPDMMAFGHEPPRFRAPNTWCGFIYAAPSEQYPAWRFFVQSAEAAIAAADEGAS